MMYDRVFVSGCKVTVTCTNRTNLPYYLYIVPADFTSWSTLPNNTEEQVLYQPFAKWKILNAMDQQIGSVQTLSMYMSTAKIYGDKNASSDDVYATLFGNSSQSGGNPTRAWFFHVGVMQPLANIIPSGTDSFRMTIKTTWYCKLFDKVKLTN